MIPDESHFQKLLEQSLQFTWINGPHGSKAVTPVFRGYTTRMRLLPFAVVTQIVGGDAEFVCEGAHPRRYRDGEAMLVPAGLRHCLTIVGPGDCTSRWAHFNITLFDSIDVLQLIDTPNILKGSEGAAIGDLCQALAEVDGQQPGVASACRRQKLGFQMVSQILEAVPPKRNIHDMVSGIVRLTPVLEFLQEHYEDAITRERLAKIVNLSPTHFHYVFKEIMGISPMHYVQQYRIAKAQLFLMNTSLGISEIAFKVGFADPFYFSRIFKSRTGESPVHYRATCRSRLIHS